MLLHFQGCMTHKVSCAVAMVAETLSSPSSVSSLSVAVISHTRQMVRHAVLGKCVTSLVEGVVKQLIPMYCNLTIQRQRLAVKLVLMVSTDNINTEIDFSTSGSNVGTYL